MNLVIKSSDSWDIFDKFKIYYSIMEFTNNIPAWKNEHYYLIVSDIIKFQCEYARGCVCVYYFAINSWDICLNHFESMSPINQKPIHIKNSIKKQDNESTLYTSWLIGLDMNPETADNINPSRDISSKQFKIINKKRNR